MEFVRGKGNGGAGDPACKPSVVCVEPVEQKTLRPSDGLGTDLKVENSCVKDAGSKLSGASSLVGRRFDPSSSSKGSTVRHCGLLNLKGSTTHRSRGLDDGRSFGCECSGRDDEEDGGESGSDETTLAGSGGAFGHKRRRQRTLRPILSSRRRHSHWSRRSVSLRSTLARRLWQLTKYPSTASPEDAKR